MALQAGHYFPVLVTDTQIASAVVSYIQPRVEVFKGPPGSPGPSGLNGSPGAKGDKGDKGDRGYPTRIRTGEVKLPLLALGIPYDATVPLSGPMGTLEYEVEILKGSTLIGNATVVVKTKNTNNVVLTITPGIAIAAGNAIQIICCE